KIDDNPDLPFLDIILNIDAYESILHSGLFTRFRPYTQISLANLYIRIKLRNNLIIYRRECKFQFFDYGTTETNELWSKTVRELDERLNSYETELIELLNIVGPLVHGEKTLAQTKLPRRLKVYFENRKPQDSNFWVTDLYHS